MALFPRNMEGAFIGGVDSFAAGLK